MIKIEQLMNVTTKALEEINTLMPQVSKDAKPITYAGLLEFLKDHNVTLLVAKDGGVIIGMSTLTVFFTIRGKRANVEHVVVDEKYRGQGIGEKLVKKTIEIAGEQNVKALELTSSPDRIVANKLYQKLGFEKRETNVYRMKL